MRGKTQWHSFHTSHPESPVADTSFSFHTTPTIAVGTWMGFQEYLLSRPAWTQDGLRKIFTGVKVSIDELPDFELSDLGYTPDKLRRLKKYYFKPPLNPADISFRGDNKDSSSRGHCILRGRYRNKTLHLFYRASESVRKFGADLIFFRDVIIPELGPTNRIVFYFSSCYIHASYFAMLGRFADPKDLLELADLAFRRTIIQATRRLLKPDVIKYLQVARLRRLLTPDLREQLGEMINADIQNG